MIGVLNSTCSWQRKEQTNKYGESTYSSPTFLPCAISKDVKLTQTDTGLIKTEEKYYILHTDVVSDGDLLDGYVVAVSEIKDLIGSTAFYKAAILNA